MSLFSTIHVLPFFLASSDYGFSVVDYLAVDPALGSWDDIARLRQRFTLMVDVVLNHVSAESAWFRAFLHGEPPYDRFFINVDPRVDLSGVTRPRTTPLLTCFPTARGEQHVWTTFSADQIDLNYAEPAVLSRMIEVMLAYVERGADLLRMDAVGYLWKEVGTACIHLPQAHQLVKLFRAVLDVVAHHVAIVTETNVPHADNLAYFGDGRDEAQMVYQFPLAPLVLDAFDHGQADVLSDWAAGLDPLSARTTFLNFIASHDGIDLVPARGLLDEAAIARLVERTLARGGQVSARANPDGTASPYELNITLFDVLSAPSEPGEPFQVGLDRFMCSQAIMLALQGVPGVYVHSLFASHSDHAAYARSGRKRDLNHGRFDLAELEAALADPTSERAQVFGRYARLLGARRAEPAFHPNAPQQVLDLGPAIFALRRGPRDGRTVLALHNVSGRRQLLADPPFDAELAVDLLGGHRLRRGDRLDLAPYGAAWLASGPLTSR